MQPQYPSENSLPPVRECLSGTMVVPTAGTTIQNGTLEGFAVGLVTNTASINKPGYFLLQNVTFKNDLTSSVNSMAIHLVNTSAVHIVGCHFVGAGKMGIFDDKSELGNSYSDLHFDGTLTTNIQVNGYVSSPGRNPFPQIVNFSSVWNQFPTLNP
jgi:hypothetical protein